MKRLGKTTKSAGLALILVLALMANIPTAWAATGNVLRQFVPTGPTGNGRGMAFDGTNHLYYTIVGDTHIYKTDMFGTLVTTITTPVANGTQPAGGPLAWDGTNLWTINYGTNGDMVQLSTSGGLVSTCNIFAANPGHPALTPPSKINFEDGLDWTGIPGSELVLSGEIFPNNSVIFMNISCGIQSWFTAPANQGAPGWGTSGVAFDGANLWHPTVNDSSITKMLIFQTTTSGTITGLNFTTPTGILTEDLAYDTVTFAPKCVLWSDSAGAVNNITAFEIPCGKKGSISGMKFNDLNGNGIKDMGEPGLANWTITLTNESGGVVTTLTNASGNYNFTNLTDGNYTVGEVIQPGWIQTAPAVSTTGSATYTVNISGGNAVAGKDFGNFFDVPKAACIETVNPAGKTVPPAGLTPPGTNPKGGQNPDGFYELEATDKFDPNPQIFVKDMGSGTIFPLAPPGFVNGTNIKYTQAPGATPGIKPIGGPNSAVSWHITGTGDAAVFAVNFLGNPSPSVSCLVPPPPK